MSDAHKVNEKEKLNAFLVEIMVVNPNVNVTIAWELYNGMLSIKFMRHTQGMFIH
jgi:hypothetical protein